MSIREFFTKMTVKLILLRCLLAVALVALCIPLIIHFISHEDLTVRTFFKYLFLAGFPAVILTVIHLIARRVERHTEAPNVYDTKPGA
jgi:hypothetical protein